MRRTEILRRDSRSQRRRPPKRTRSASSRSPRRSAAASTRSPTEGIQCTLPNAKSGVYGGVRNFWMLTKGPKKGEAAKFINWVESGNKTVQSIITSEWISLK